MARPHNPKFLLNLRNGPGIHARDQTQRDLPQGISFRPGKPKPYHVRVGKSFYSKHFEHLREAVVARAEQVERYNKHHKLGELS